MRRVPRALTSSGTRAAISSTVGIWETSKGVASVVAAPPEASAPLGSEADCVVAPGSEHAARTSADAAVSARRAAVAGLCGVCISGSLSAGDCRYGISMHHHAWLCIICDGCPFAMRTPARRRPRPLRGLRPCGGPLLRPVRTTAARPVGAAPGSGDREGAAGAAPSRATRAPLTCPAGRAGSGAPAEGRFPWGSAGCSPSKPPGGRRPAGPPRW